MGASFETQGREAYWLATQSELKSIRKRGDILTLAGATTLLALIFIYRDLSQSLAAWLIAATALLAVIGTSLWFVISRKRRGPVRAAITRFREWAGASQTRRR